jgi:hypothetical protein
MINFFNSSWLLINSCSIMYINTDAVSLNEINIVYLINLFTIVNMLSNLTFHAEFFDDDNFIMKFIVTDFHNLFTHQFMLLHHIVYLSESCFSAWITLSDVFVIQFLKSLTLHLLCTRFSFIWLQDVHQLCCCNILILIIIHQKAFFTLYVAAKSFVRISLFSLRISVWTYFTSSWSNHLLKVSASSFSLSFL